MKVSEFDFDLPPELIAARPAEPRDSCRLLSVKREGGFGDLSMRELPGLLKELAERAGKEPAYIEALLRIFGDQSLSNICIPDARCDVCEVSFCNRLRYR